MKVEEMFEIIVFFSYGFLSLSLSRPRTGYLNISNKFWFFKFRLVDLFFHFRANSLKICCTFIKQDKRHKTPTTSRVIKSTSSKCLTGRKKNNTLTCTTHSSQTCETFENLTRTNDSWAFLKARVAQREKLKESQVKVLTTTTTTTVTTTTTMTTTLTTTMATIQRRPRRRFQNFTRREQLFFFFTFTDWIN